LFRGDLLRPVRAAVQMDAVRVYTMPNCSTYYVINNVRSLTSFAAKRAFDVVVTTCRHCPVIATANPPGRLSVRPSVCLSVVCVQNRHRHNNSGIKLSETHLWDCRNNTELFRLATERIRKGAHKAAEIKQNEIS